MTEAEYIIATNRVKVSAALHLMRDVLSGDEFGISDTDLAEILGKLCSLEVRLFSLVSLEEIEK